MVYFDKYRYENIDFENVAFFFAPDCIIVYWYIQLLRFVSNICLLNIRNLTRESFKEKN